MNNLIFKKIALSFFGSFFFLISILFIYENIKYHASFEIHKSFLLNEEKKLAQMKSLIEFSLDQGQIRTLVNNDIISNERFDSLYLFLKKMQLDSFIIIKNGRVFSVSDSSIVLDSINELVDENKVFSRSRFFRTKNSAYFYYIYNFSVNDDFVSIFIKSTFLDSSISRVSDNLSYVYLFEQNANVNGCVDNYLASCISTFDDSLQAYYVTKIIEPNYNFTVYAVVVIFFIIIFITIYNFSFKQQNYFENKKNLHLDVKQYPNDILFADDIFYNFLHELRNNLGAIKGFNELLIDTELTSGQRDKVNFVLKSSSFQLKILNHLTDYTNVHNRSYVNNDNVSNLSHLFDSIFEYFTVLYDDQKIDFDLNNVVDNSLLFQTEPLRILLENCLDNAFKFSDFRKVTIDSFILDSNLCFRISNLCNHKNEIQFDIEKYSFNDLKRHSHSTFFGIGVGLSMCKIIVNDYNGIFNVEFPFEDLVEVNISIPLSKIQTTQIEDLDNLEKLLLDTPPRILITEDDLANFTLIKSYLNIYGIKHIERACTGSEAIKLVREHHFDLIFMDIRMPELNGFETSKIIRDMGIESAETKIIAITGDAFSINNEALTEYGIDDILVKPCEKHIIFQVINKYLLTNFNND